MKNIFRNFRPQPVHASLTEKICSGVAGGFAILLLGLALRILPQGQYQMIMLASIAASAVLLFAVPHSLLAQPWNLIGGHLIASIPGWWCGILIDDPVVAGAAAVGLAIFLMYYFHCLHPPGAATALTLVLAGQQFHPMGEMWVLYVIAGNVVIFMVLTLIINNALPGRHYPMEITSSSVPKTNSSITIETDDIAWALSKMDSTIDVTEQDLVTIYKHAMQHAHERVVSK